MSPFVAGVQFPLSLGDAVGDGIIIGMCCAAMVRISLLGGFNQWPQ